MRSLVSKRCLHQKPHTIPMNEVYEFDKNSSVINASASSIRSPVETKVTKLENGMRVASDNSPGAFSTVGVLLESGCRYEANYTSGITHFLEKLAYSSTSVFASRDHIAKKIEQVRGVYDCQTTRDITCYAMSASGTDGPAAVVEILAEVTQRPLFSSDELAQARAVIRNEIETRNMMPEQDSFMLEMIHAAAYQGNTVGLPKFCPVENLESIDAQQLYTFMRHNYRPENMVLVGVGLEHEGLVDLANKQFVHKTPIWFDRTKNVGAADKPSRDNSISQFTGGIVKKEVDLSSISLGPTQMPDLAHVSIGLQSCSNTDPDLVVYAVLNMLLGGGGSFSAGGPGKGMYTRLYTYVLNQHHWVHNCTAMNHPYSDSGLFVINGSAPPNKLPDLVDVIIRQFLYVAESVQKEELDRAKTQLKSFLLMNLESKPVAFEDIGRQVLSFGHRRSTETLLDLIDAVKADDIYRVGAKLLKSKLAVAARGQLKTLPEFEKIQHALISGSMVIFKKEKTDRSYSWFR